MCKVRADNHRIPSRLSSRCHSDHYSTRCSARVDEEKIKLVKLVRRIRTRMTVMAALKNHRKALSTGRLQSKKMI